MDSLAFQSGTGTEKSKEIDAIDLYQASHEVLLDYLYVKAWNISPLYFSKQLENAPYLAGKEINQEKQLIIEAPEHITPNPDTAPPVKKEEPVSSDKQEPPKVIMSTGPPSKSIQQKRV